MLPSQYRTGCALNTLHVCEPTRTSHVELQVNVIKIKLT